MSTDIAARLERLAARLPIAYPGPGGAIAVLRHGEVLGQDVPTAVLCLDSQMGQIAVLGQAPYRTLFEEVISVSGRLRTAGQKQKDWGDVYAKP